MGGGRAEVKDEDGEVCGGGITTGPEFPHLWGKYGMTICLKLFFYF